MSAADDWSVCVCDVMSSFPYLIVYCHHSALWTDLDKDQQPPSSCSFATDGASPKVVEIADYDHLEVVVPILDRHH